MQNTMAMKIAIIGTGLAGLAAGWFLKRLGSHVTYFDKRGIGRGASGVAAGLLHPYVGEQTRPSLWAKEAAAESKALIQQVSPKSILEEGIIRIAQSDEQKRALQSYADVDPLGDSRFLIKSGLVIDTKGYLQDLFDATGAELIIKEIENDQSLQQFDRILIAAGHGADRFLPQYKSLVSMKKGQLLDIHLKEPMQSTIAKGYLAKGMDTYHWGSTYESCYESELPDTKTALAILEKNEFPFTSSPEVVSCRAGVRLTRKGHYVPIATKIEKKVWWFGALGSRGLLYHAYLGRKMAEAMLCDDLELLPKECRIRCRQNSFS